MRVAPQISQLWTSMQGKRISSTFISCQRNVSTLCNVRFREESGLLRSKQSGSLLNSQERVETSNLIYIQHALLEKRLILMRIGLLELMLTQLFKNLIQTAWALINLQLTDNQHSKRSFKKFLNKSLSQAQQQQHPLTHRILKKFNSLNLLWRAKQKLSQSWNRQFKNLVQKLLHLSLLDHLSSNLGLKIASNLQMAMPTITHQLNPILYQCKTTNSQR